MTDEVDDAEKLHRKKESSSRGQAGKMEPESALLDKDADDDKVRSKCSLPVAAAAAFSAAECIEPSPELRQCSMCLMPHVQQANSCP